MTPRGNPHNSRPKSVPYTTAEIGIELLMDVTNGLAEIHDRLTAHAFGAVHNPEKGPAVRRVLAGLMEVLDDSSPDGLI